MGKGRRARLNVKQVHSNRANEPENMDYCKYSAAILFIATEPTLTSIWRCVRNAVNYTAFGIEKAPFPHVTNI